MDYYDDLPEDDESEYYDYEPHEADSLTLDNLLENRRQILGECSIQVLKTAILDLILPVVFVNLFLKMYLFLCTRYWGHVNHQKPTAIVGTLFLVYHFWSRPLLAVFLLTFVTVISFCSAYRYISSIAQQWTVCLTVVGCNEIILFYWDRDFLKLRPLLMLFTMKTISFQFWESKTANLSSLTYFGESMAYLLHPEGLPAGGYHPYAKPTARLSLQAAKKALVALFWSLAFLLISTCLVQDLVTVWLQQIVAQMLLYFPLLFCYVFELACTTYFTALQFRTSHYFVCYVMEFAHRIWGYETHVAKPSMVELPRSLVDVVVAWNVPMHSWLKKHVFEYTKGKFGSLKAIFATYFISSFLHGVNFQIWSVLLSLGILTWSEFVLRKKLADIYSACVEARSCQLEGQETEGWTFLTFFKQQFPYLCKRESTKCTRGHSQTKANSLSVIVVNLMFGLLAMIHLAFLGSSFDGREEPSNYDHVIKTWSNLKFYSHFIAIFTIFIYKVIE